MAHPANKQHLPPSKSHQELLREIDRLTNAEEIRKKVKAAVAEDTPTWGVGRNNAMIERIVKRLTQ